MGRNTKIVLVFALVISLAGAALVYAERGNGRGGRFGGQLTQEQREAVHATVVEMRGAGASHEEIHAAVREMLEGYGIEVPEGPPEGFRKGDGERRGPGGRFGDRLLVQSKHPSL